MMRGWSVPFKLFRTPEPSVGRFRAAAARKCGLRWCQLLADILLRADRPRTFRTGLADRSGPVVLHPRRAATVYRPSSAPDSEKVVEGLAGKKPAGQFSLCARPLRPICPATIWACPRSARPERSLWPGTFLLSAPVARRQPRIKVTNSYGRRRLGRKRAGSSGRRCRRSSAQKLVAAKNR